MAAILFVDDEQAAQLNYKTILEHYGHEVFLASDLSEVRAALKLRRYDLAITDMRLGTESGLDVLREVKRSSPQLDVIVLTAHAEIPNAIEAMRVGALDYLTKGADYKEILFVIDKALEKRKLVAEIEALRTQLERGTPVGRIAGSSAAISRLRSQIERIGRTNSRVLITGESGTGKELVAHYIHAESTRSRNPFLAINCGAIAKNLQESELFGYVKGAFTSASTAKKGLLEVADTGTVLLDEIGEMTPETQATLLRFLENAEVTPVGDVRPRKVDVRILAATHRNLAELVEQGRFREDLFYRLNVATLHLPPLRDRKEDIAEIVEAALPELNERTGRRVTHVTQAALEALRAYHWPGNVRELRNLLERALIFTDSDTIDLGDLPEDLFARTGAPAPGPLNDREILTLDDAEKQHILATLARLGGNKLLTARHLNIAVTTLYRKLKAYGVE